MLARVFGDHKEGFYVDIGACFPDVASVTKHFYDCGWSGINIEPMAEPYERLAAERPRDVNLNIAIAACTGDIAMFEGPSVGESSALRPHDAARPIAVPCLTLADLCRKYVTCPIDFLKIDVEGLERDVVMSGDWDAFRPTVVVIEVTLPWSTMRRPDAVEIGAFLASKGYAEVYFDGLNAFYLAAEASDLAPWFSCPPNVLDRFVQAREAELTAAVGQAQQEAAASMAMVAAAESRATDGAAQEHESRLQAHAEWLQNEGDAAKQRVEELSQRTRSLEGELDSERQRTVQLGAELQAAREHESRLQAHAEWLQNEWDAAKIKIDEINHSSHHWWTVADQFNRELQGVYASKSWRITAPLRKTMLTAKRALALPTRTVRWALRLPKRMAKPLVVWVMRQTLANSGLKARALSVLTKRPQLKQHLRQFAMRSGLMAGDRMTSPTNHPSETGSGPQNTVAHFTVNVMSPVTQSSPTTSVPLSPITNANMTAMAPADENSLYASLVRAMQAWPLGRRIDGR